MKVYIAAPLHLRIDAEKAAALLVAAGHDVGSTWHRSPASTAEAERTLGPVERSDIARKCLAEVDASDAVLLLYGLPSFRGGSIFEAGVAVGQGKRVFAAPVEVIPHASNYVLPTLLLCARCLLCESVAEAVRAIGELHEGKAEALLKSSE